MLNGSGRCKALERVLLRPVDTLECFFDEEDEPNECWSVIGVHEQFPMVCLKDDAIGDPGFSPAADHFEGFLIEWQVFLDFFIIFGVVHHSRWRYDETPLVPLPGQTAARIVEPAARLLDHFETAQFVHVPVLGLEEVMDGLPPQHAVCHRNRFIFGLQHIV